MFWAEEVKRGTNLSIWHEDNASVAFSPADMSKTDTSISCGPLHNGPSRPQPVQVLDFNALVERDEMNTRTDLVPQHREQPQVQPCPSRYLLGSGTPPSLQYCNRSFQTISLGESTVK